MGGRTVSALVAYCDQLRKLVGAGVHAVRATQHLRQLFLVERAAEVRVHLVEAALDRL